jgi:UDP-N-acetylglucosamine 2-epimerase
VVSKTLRETTRIDDVVVHTGQHFDDNLSPVFFAELGMAEPRYNLGVHGGTHTDMMDACSSRSSGCCRPSAPSWSCGPVGYLDIVGLEKFAALIVTDSGGVQKEAFFRGVSCVTLRDEMKWTELIGSGWNRLASPRNGETLGQDALEALGSHGQAIQPYSDGTASLRIAQHLGSLC